MAYTLHLGNAHSRFPSIRLDQLVRVIQCPPTSNNHHNARLAREVHNLTVSLSRICIGILFEH